MPVGSFFGDVDTGRSSLTGSGPASQPRNPRAASWLDITPGSTGMTAGRNQPGATNPTPTTTAFNPSRVGLFGFMDPANRPSTSNALAQQAVGPNPLTGARSLLDAYYGPQSSLLDQTLARQQSQLGLVGVNADYDRSALNRDAALDRRGLDLQRSNVGLDRESLGVDANLTRGQMANLDKLRAILGKQFGLNREQLDVQLADLGIDEAKLKDMAGRQKFDLRSALTARGAFNTVANKRGTGRIDRDLTYGLGQIGNARRQADINYRGADLGLQEKGIGYDNQGLSLNARLSNIGIDNRRLDNALTKIGLDEEALGNALTDGLRNIGLAEFTDINNLLDMIGSTNVQQAELARTILEQVIGYADLPPEVLAELMAGLAAGNTRTPTAPAGGAGGRNL